jgi:hypothetical protein
MSERWDEPSKKLAKLAALDVTPNMRLCPACDHRHVKGVCGYPEWDADDRGEFCRCAQ